MRIHSLSFLRDLFGEELQNGALSDSKEATDERYISYTGAVQISSK